MVKTLFPEPKTASQAAFVIRVMERGQRLIEDGYVIRQRSRKTLFAIFKPGNTSRHADYVVDMIPNHEHCSCKGFRAGDCKHRIACSLLLDEQARDAAQVAAFEEMEDGRLFIEACAAEHSTGYRF